MIKPKQSLLSPERELDIKLRVSVIRTYLDRCPNKCVFHKMLWDYIMLFDAYQIEKTHNRTNYEPEDRKSWTKLKTCACTTAWYRFAQKLAGKSKSSASSLLNRSGAIVASIVGTITTGCATIKKRMLR